MIGALLRAVLKQAVPTLLTVVLLRSMPFVGYVCVAKNGRRGFRAGIALGFGLVFLLSYLIHRELIADLIWAPAFFAYFVAGGLIVHWLVGVLGIKTIRCGGVLVISAITFMFVPAMFQRSRVAAAFVIFGWE